jgi:hypothetical protein
MEIFEKKNNKVGKNKFYNEQKQVKNCVSKYVLKIMELNVRIAIPQLVDKNQVYEEIPPVLVSSQHPVKIKISIRCVSVK